MELNLLTSPYACYLRRQNSRAAEEGEEVSANQIVIVMEAMKMEHSIEAPRSGQIVELNVAVGDIVSDGQSLAIIKDTCE